MFNEKNLDNIIPFRFLVLNIKNKDQKAYKEIIDLFLELVDIKDYLVKDDNIILFYHEKEENIEEIIEAINYDFDALVKVFDSSPIYSSKTFKNIYNCYMKYLKDADIKFTSISDLILEVVKNNYLELKNIKHDILNKIYNDQQIEKLILGMFEANLNVTKTATLTYMHRNTTNYKLAMIEKETSLNIQNFKDAMSMYFILKCDR